MTEFTPDFDDGPHHRAQLGFIAVANADLTERDLFRMKPEGVGVHFTRVKMPEQCTLDSLASMGAALDDTLDTLMPARTDVDVICYNCTSGSFVIGENKIIDKIKRKQPNVIGTTLLTGVVAAFKALGVTKIAMATAYTDDINQLEREYFANNSVEIVAMHGLGLMNDTEMNKVTPDSLLALARHIDCAEAEAIFFSCGALRSVDIIQLAEAELGKPFVCSNQASMWQSLRLANIDDQFDGFGQLFSRC